MMHSMILGRAYPFGLDNVDTDMIIAAIGPASLEVVLAHARQGAISIDLKNRIIGLGDDQMPFTMEPGQSDRLLSGLDEVGMTLKHRRDIAEFEQRQLSWHGPGSARGKS